MANENDTSNESQWDDKYKQLVRDYKTVFSTPEGLKVLKDLTEKSILFRSVISPDPSVPVDANRVLYTEGQRSVLVYIYNKINTNLNTKD